MIENSAPPVGLEPTTPCIPGKHTTTKGGGGGGGGGMQVVGDGSGF